MGLLMPEVGMRTGCNFPCNSAGGVLRTALLWCTHGSHCLSARSG
ncbi:hypothetical protein PCL1606_59530 [Pseudomonas chlororaphis]|uniref:Uncharacterized protein n=1 Tax=Pseudomonas chlororaphis TaxID=587753 RepID=A0A0D5Y7T5_9PSED|nr:hypothetical protein PCL1606_59530 [Pseudomonas chlororaphis]